ncbi:uncharacterized protein LOC112590755 isoform X2 [Harpegnathos saltator]|uniref:uncharacterized protein LOC112590755 isoform X2 n=1 Tax=Harpegnathos saltator TaxID=610380 RepID=UPI000DBEEC97|nr:uncharacterized protein LOC112590755 isoform X2 [Harpegnathos saltator]
MVIAVDVVSTLSFFLLCILNDSSVSADRNRWLDEPEEKQQRIVYQSLSPRSSTIVTTTSVLRSLVPRVSDRRQHHHHRDQELQGGPGHQRHVELVT